MGIVCSHGPKSAYILVAVVCDEGTRTSDRIFAKLQWKKACTVDNFIEISGFAVIHCMYSASHFSRNLQSYKISVKTKIAPVYIMIVLGTIYCILIDCAFTFDLKIVGWLSFLFKKLTFLWIHFSLRFLYKTKISFFLSCNLYLIYLL